MVDLRRFPVSDEFISDRYTICVILDRIFSQNFELCGVARQMSTDQARGVNARNGCDRSLSTAARTATRPALTGSTCWVVGTD